MMVILERYRRKGFYCLGRSNFLLICGRKKPSIGFKFKKEVILFSNLFSSITFVTKV